MADAKESVPAKIVGGIAALVAAWAVQKLIDKSWQRVTGHSAPKPEDEGDNRFSEIVAATAVSGALVAIARVLATRGTAKFIR